MLFSIFSLLDCAIDHRTIIGVQCPYRPTTVQYICRGKAITQNCLANISGSQHVAFKERAKWSLPICGHETTLREQDSTRRRS
jgi:hypothetical protein